MATMLTTLTALKLELGITGSADDARLTSLIEQASSQIENYCGRSFGRGNVTETIEASDTVFDWTAHPSLRMNSRHLWLDRPPVITLTSVTIDGTLLDPAYYSVRLIDGRLTSLQGWGWWGGDTVVVYTGGFILPGNVGADLPPAVERACLDLALGNWHTAARDPMLRSETIPGILEQTWTAAPSVELSAGMAVGLSSMLAPYRRLEL